MDELIEAIKQRYSCRSFLPQSINPKTMLELESYLNINRNGIFGEELAISIIEKSPESQKSMKLDYGIILNHSNYLVGKVKCDPLQRMSYGYVVEKLVIKATALGLNTCWIGYFDPNHFPEIRLPKGFEIPSIVIVGYEGRSTLGDKAIKFTVGAARRNDWNQLFFHNNFSTPLKREDSGLFENSLEMLRLAPSSGNTQPWRVVLEDHKIFHFYKKPISKHYQTKGLHDVDMGIALSHFDLTSKFYNLGGDWERLPSKQVLDHSDVEYMISFISTKKLA